MTSTKLYDYLEAWLSGAVEAAYRAQYGRTKEASIRGYGRYDKKYYPGREKTLRTIVRQCICYGRERMILSDEDGGSLYAYNGLYYEPISRGEVFLMELIKRVFRRLGVGDWYNDEVPSRQIARSCMSTITSSSEYLYLPNKRYIAFLNGIFDLKDGKLKEARIEYRPYIMLDFAYRGKEDIYRECAQRYGLGGNPCRLWDEKIQQILPNADVRSAFQQWCGSLLIDREEYKQESVVYLIGPGANGKSVLANVIVNLFGERYFSRFTLRQLFKDDYRNNRANLRGKIANFIDDLDERRIGGEDFKSVASGALLEARPLYEKKTIKVSAPPILCCTNSMPESSDDSYGHHRRQLPLYTTAHRFVGAERDPRLTYKLSTEEARCYIFSWVYEGYRRVINNNGEIKLGETVIQAQADLEGRSNSMRRWWGDNGYEAIKEYDRDSWRTIAELYQEYEAYCEAEGSIKFQRSEFSAMLAAKGCAKQKLAVGYGYCLTKPK